MSKIHLTKSPIREALVDFKFIFTSPVDLQKLEMAHDEVKNMYPVKEVISTSSVVFDMRPGGKPKLEQSEGTVGYRFLNNTKDTVVQFRADGLTFSKLQPYSSWEEVLKETKKVYDIYLKATKVDKVARIATRYINLINVTKDSYPEIKKYFNFYPTIPSSIETPLDNFLTRLSFEDRKLDLTTVVNQGIVIEPNANGENLKYFLFDIDCYKQNLSLDKGNPWEELQTIKDNTNKVFFDGITQFTVENFK